MPFKYNKYLSSRHSFGRVEREIPSTSSAISGQHFYLNATSEETLPFCKRFKQYLYNKEQKTFCSRTLKSWGLVISVYLIFLCIISLLFFGLTYGCLYYLKKSKRPLLNKSSVFSSGPGISFLPNIAQSETPLVWYNKGLPEKKRKKRYYQPYIDYIENYFNRYTDAEQDKQHVDCSIKKPNNSASCLFKIADLGPCGKPDYGYDKYKPCVYLKLNKLMKWKPDYYHDDNLPDNMPSDLKEVIRTAATKKFVWVYCNGFEPHDQEHIGRMSYYPQPGFSGNFFPYTGNYSYLQPIVAVQFINLKPGFVINVLCEPWARNIINEHGDKSVKIQLYIPLS